MWFVGRFNNPIHSSYMAGINVEKLNTKEACNLLTSGSKLAELQVSTLSYPGTFLSSKCSLENIDLYPPVTTPTAPPHAYINSQQVLSLHAPDGNCRIMPSSLSPWTTTIKSGSNFPPLENSQLASFPTYCRSSAFQLKWINNLGLFFPPPGVVCSPLRTKLNEKKWRC